LSGEAASAEFDAIVDESGRRSKFALGNIRYDGNSGTVIHRSPAGHCPTFRDRRAAEERPPPRNG
jgi:hypothetical protein